MPTTTGKKIAIVTGSALGLGYELASQLIANGWLVQNHGNGPASSPPPAGWWPVSTSMPNVRPN